MKYILLCILIFSCPILFADSKDAEDKTNTVDPIIDNYVPVPESPFKFELDLYFHRRKIGSDMMLWSVVGFAAGGIISTVGKTGVSSGWWDDTTGAWMEYPSYGIMISASVTLIWGFLKWKDNTEKYLDTIRLQSNYYNLISD